MRSEDGVSGLLLLGTSDLHDGNWVSRCPTDRRRESCFTWDHELVMASVCMSVYGGQKGSLKCVEVLLAYNLLLCFVPYFFSLRSLFSSLRSLVNGCSLALHTVLTFEAANMPPEHFCDTFCTLGIT